MINRKKMMTIFALGLLSLGLAACETMEGAGKDIEHAGESIQDAANQVRTMNNKGLLTVLAVLLIGILAIILIQLIKDAPADATNKGITEISFNAESVREQINKNACDVHFLNFKKAAIVCGFFLLLREHEYFLCVCKTSSITKLKEFAQCHMT